MVINLQKLVKINTYLVSLLIYLLIFKEINLAYNLIFIFLFMFAVYRDFFKYLYIPRIALNSVAIFSLIIMALRLSLSDLVVPVMETLLILLSLKLLEDKKFRDYMQIYLIITLIFSAYSLLSISIFYILYLLVYIFLLNFSIIVLTYYTEDSNINLNLKELKEIFVKTSIIPIVSVPLTVFIFFFIPRTNYPIFNILSTQSKGKTGFSDNVSLGEVSTIQEDNQLVMRVVMKNVGEIYIRGITFNLFDGKSWKNTIPITINTKKFMDKGSFINYTAYLEPTEDIYVFVLDLPYQIDFGKFTKDYYPYIKNDLSVITTTPINSRIMYKGVSILTDKYKEETPLGYYLLLPSNLSPRIVEYGKMFSQEDKFKTAVKILTELQKFEYSLSDLPQGENILEKFLFEKKKGNCEYFATAMAILLRINGIPSRVVGGYKTYTYNDIGKYYIVKQKDAHLWVEAYINGFWMRFDPTPPIRNQVIDKIEQPSKLKLLIDSINYYYNAFILNYDFSKQQKLYSSIKAKFSNISNFKPSKDMFIIIFSAVIVAILILSGYYLYTILNKSYEEKLISMFFKKMKKYGYNRYKNEGLEDFCSKIEDISLKAKCLKFVSEIQPYVFGRKKMTEKDYRDLKETLKDIL